MAKNRSMTVATSTGEAELKKSIFGPRDDMPHHRNEICPGALSLLRTKPGGRALCMGALAE